VVENHEIVDHAHSPVSQKAGVDRIQTNNLFPGGLKAQKALMMECCAMAAVF
jgi:hypothetical protein